ncbi:MAG: protein-L-isoaspartate O-methyltransferase [Sphingomonadaceae bacterium]
MGAYDFEAMRRAMIASQLRTTAVDDPRVLAAAGAVPREDFVPPGKRALAYIDRVLPIAKGRGLSPPLATARLVEELRPRDGEKALIVGAASGYSAALLSRLLGAQGEVVALEEDPDLAAIGARALEEHANVVRVEGPLAAGWPDRAPYDLILVDGAAEHLPAALIAQLAPSGRLAAGLVEDGVVRLVVGRRAGEGFGYSAFADADAARLPGFERPRSFQF